jgi:DNA-binding response OmpR family regulator
MLSARETPEDRLTGLNAGADDYLSKTAGFEQLLWRIRALLRRVTVSRPTLLRVADLTLDLVSHRVMRGNRVIDLTPTEFAILAVLMRHAGGLVTRTRLTESVWEGETDSHFNVIDVHVGHIRKKLDYGGAIPLIRTIRRAGYTIRHPGGRKPRAEGGD